MKVAILLHLLGAVVWIGGMFFAYLCLRPAAGALDAPVRLALWAETLRRFLLWVWVAVALVLSSGFYMLSIISELGHVPAYIHVMLYVGVLMSLIFAYVYFSPFPALRQAVAASDWKTGAVALNQIRLAVAVNLVLGLLNVAVATVGKL